MEWGVEILESGVCRFVYEPLKPGNCRIFATRYKNRYHFANGSQRKSFRAVR